ncbi:MAG: ATP-binding cassette domain-containing protein [Candidatus Nomurabacteria bacterium]|nr:ATP-binding cassette domain-containing protein [Candidatus Nomurabacteria bacterium]
MKTPDPIIIVRDFAMNFGDQTVIKNLNFTVQRGETFGFLGSNGSGKTTTIRALLGIYQPSEGELLINGKTFQVDGATKIGYLPESRGLYEKETVRDVMNYFGELKGLSHGEATDFTEKYLARVNLSEYIDSKISKLSGGQQQKIQLGITVMNEPDLLILDEPTKGFDPVNRRLLMDIIKEHQDRGATVLMISHQMDDVEKLCDHILLLKDGVAREFGTVPEVRKKYNNASLEDIFLKIYGAENDTVEGAQDDNGIPKQFSNDKGAKIKTRRQK